MKESLINIINLLLSLPVVYLILLKQSLLHFFFFFTNLRILFLSHLTHRSLTHVKLIPTIERKREGEIHRKQTQPG